MDIFGLQLKSIVTILGVEDYSTIIQLSIEAPVVGNPAFLFVVFANVFPVGRYDCIRVE